jgi:hypothetical protein
MSNIMSKTNRLISNKHRHGAVILTALTMVCALFAYPSASEASEPTKLGVAGLSPLLDLVLAEPGETIVFQAVSTASGTEQSARWFCSSGIFEQRTESIAEWRAPYSSGTYLVKAEGDNGLERALTVVVTVPTQEVKEGKLNGYKIGQYPKGYGRHHAQLASRSDRPEPYEVPGGFVELSKANLNAPVSEHYTIGDFQAHDSWVNGKKYLFVQPRLLEKLERGIQLLGWQGYDDRKLELMSAYRSPYLNSIIGNETALSRHTYGDAADMLVIDFNRDGKVDLKDGKILFNTFDRLDKETNLKGGLSLYKPTAGHGYFVHSDTRGHIARW